MKTITRTVATGIVASILLFTSCSKDGATGPAGPQGAAGLNGTNGAANVQAFTGQTQNSSWTVNSNNIEWDAAFSVPAITSTVLSSGTVQVFIGDAAGDNWQAMPLSSGQIQYNYSYQLNQISIQVTLSNGNLPAIPGIQYFKMVVIPQSMIKPHVNMHNYADVKAAYNL